MTEEISELPYEENEEGFIQWFRTAAKDELDLLLHENDARDGERRSVLLDFLYKNGTQEEIDAYLGTLRRKGLGLVAMNVEEWLPEKRPDLTFY